MPTTRHMFSEGKQIVRKTYHYWREHGSKQTVLRAADVLMESPPVSSQVAIPDKSRGVWRNRFGYLTGLPTYSIPRTRPRLNLVTDSINTGQLYGGVGTALILTALLAEKLGCDMRIITRTERANEQNFAQLMELAGITELGNVEFKWVKVGATAPIDLDLGKNELFITTSWWSTWCISQSVAADRIVYLLQEDERMFYPYDDDRLLCSELMKKSDITFLINSKLLFDHLVNDGFTNLLKQGHWFEPSFPQDTFFLEPPAANQQKRQFLFYARPNNGRNLFYRGLQAIQLATASGILDPAQWELNFVGKDIPFIELAKDVQPKRHENLAWKSYASLIRSMDIGLSLMYTPHPSYPPLDLAASGAVAVTNRFGNKQNLDQYSKNIICVEPDVDDLVRGLAAGVKLAADRGQRTANYENSGILRDWRTSFANILAMLATKFS